MFKSINNRIEHILTTKNYLLIILFLILAIFSCSLLFSTHTLYGSYDLGFHLRRVLELRADILHGQFLPVYSFNQWHGAAIMALYPCISIYPITLLSFLIKSPITLIYVTYIIYEFTLLLISFYSCNSFSKSKKVSFLFSIIYGLSVMPLYAQFRIMDMGMISALTFLPLVIFGAFRLLKENQWLELSIGMTLIIYSHVISSFISIGFVILLLLFSIKYVTKQNLISAFKSSIMTILLTSIVWLPALKFIPIFLHHNLSTPASMPVANAHGESIISIIQGVYQVDPFTFGLIQGIAILLIIFLYKKLQPNEKIMFYVAIFILLFSSKLFPWPLASHGIMKLFGIIQFPGRLCIIPQVIMSYLLAVVVIKDISNIKIRRICTICTLIFVVLIQMYGQIKVKQQSALSPVITSRYFKDHTQGIKYNSARLPIKLLPNYQIKKSNNVKYIMKPQITYKTDYYPKDSLVKGRQINNYLGIYNNKYNIHVKHSGFNTFQINNSKRINTLALPLMYYSNDLHVYLNHHRAKYHPNNNNMITLNNVNSGHNQIFIKPVHNIYMNIVKSIMFSLGIIWIILITIKLKRLTYNK